MSTEVPAPTPVPAITQLNIATDAPADGNMGDKDDAGSNSITIPHDQASAAEGSQAQNGDGKIDSTDSQPTLDMNDPSSYAPVMQAMQSGDYNLASQLMGKCLLIPYFTIIFEPANHCICVLGMASGMNPNMTMNMFNSMNPMGNMGFPNANMFGGGGGVFGNNLASGAFGGGTMGMGPMGGMGPMAASASSGFNGYHVPFGAPPPFHPVTGLPQFVGIGGTSGANNLPGNHNPSSFPTPTPPPNPQHHHNQFQSGPNYAAPYSGGRGGGRGGRGGRGAYGGFRGGRGGTGGFEFQNHGGFGQNAYNGSQQGMSQSSHAGDFDTTPIKFENGQAPMIEINGGTSKPATVVGEQNGQGEDGDHESNKVGGAASSMKEKDGDEDESDADSLVIKLDGDENEEEQQASTWQAQGHGQVHQQQPFHNQGYPAFNRQASSQSGAGTSVFSDAANGVHNALPQHQVAHHQGPADLRQANPAHGHNGGIGNGAGFRPHHGYHISNPPISSPHYPQHGSKPLVNGFGHRGINAGGPYSAGTAQSLPLRKPAGTGVVGAPTGPKAMREPAGQAAPSLQINVHKARASYGSAKGMISEKTDRSETSGGRGYEREARYVNNGSPTHIRPASMLNVPLPHES